MTEDEILSRLYDLQESDGEGLGKLAHEIGLQCREPAVTVLTEWISGPPQRQTPCAFICSHLKELAIGEMLRQSASVTPALRVQLMEMVTAQQLAFRELMLTALEPLLEDLTPDGTETPGDLRTCDTAYLLVRKIVRVKGAEASRFSDEKHFKDLQPIERDTEIDNWVVSETWKEIFPQPLR
jgi:hypothetical protein